MMICGVCSSLLDVLIYDILRNSPDGLSAVVDQRLQNILIFRTTFWKVLWYHLIEGNIAILYPHYRHRPSVLYSGGGGYLYIES